VVSHLQTTLQELTTEVTPSIQVLGDYGVIVNDNCNDEKLSRMAALIKGRTLSSIFFPDPVFAPQLLEEIVREVVVCSSKASNNSACRLLQALAKAEKVADLTLFNPLLSDDQLKIANEVLEKCPIRSLRIFSNPASKNLASFIMKALSSQPLYLFALKQGVLSLEDARTLALSIKRQHTLKVLDLSGTPLDRKALAPLKEMLENDRILEQFSFSPQFTGDACDLLQAILDNFQTALSQLIIVNEHNLSDEEILRTISLRSITELRINRIGEPVRRMVALTNSLIQNRNLRLLEINDCNEDLTFRNIFDYNTTLQSCMGQGRQLYVEETEVNKKAYNRHLFRWMQCSILMACMKSNAFHTLRNFIIPLKDCDPSLLQTIALMAAMTDQEQLGSNYDEKHSMENHFVEANGFLPSLGKFLNTRFYLNQFKTTKSPSSICCIQ
jgi:hypothetical protein